VFDTRILETFDIKRLGEFQCTSITTELGANGVSNESLFEYNWSTDTGIILFDGNTPKATIRGEGVYILTLTNKETGCESIDSIALVLDEQSLQTAIIDIEPPSCRDFANASILIEEVTGGFPPYNITLDGNEYGPTQQVLFLAAGSHELLVTDSLGCEVVLPVLIEEGDYPEVTLPADTIILLGDSVTILADIFPAETSNLSIEWSSNAPCDDCTSFTIAPQSTYFAEITVTDDNDCSASADITISVDGRDPLIFPNIFSPNGDDHNDVFYMPYTNGISNIASLKIYDWFGTLVYSADNLIPGNEEQGWNGNHLGKRALEGVYMIQANITLVNGQSRTVVSDVTLVR